MQRATRQVKLRIRRVKLRIRIAAAAYSRRLAAVCAVCTLKCRKLRQKIGEGKTALASKAAAAKATAIKEYEADFGASVSCVRDGSTPAARQEQGWYAALRRKCRSLPRLLCLCLRRMRGLFEQLLFSSLTRRIIILNLLALCALVASIMYFNRFRDGLIEAKMDNLRLQGRMIAGAVAASATVDTGVMYMQPSAEGKGDDMVETWYFPIDSDRISHILRRVIAPSVTRAVIYDRDERILLDSRRLYSDGNIVSYNLPPIDEEEQGFFGRFYEHCRRLIFGANSASGILGKNSEAQLHKMLRAAQQGNIVTAQSRSRQGELIVSVAVPIQRYHAVLGVLLLSTAGTDIDYIVHSERRSVFKIFMLVSAVMLLLLLLLASAVAMPLRRLSDALRRVRIGTDKRVKIPDYSFRRDEIGHLSTSIAQMTDALYTRIEAIERFAADVSHELKNPLTSLRSAVEALPLAQTETAKKSLLDIIEHDVCRLDRLITDISSASRLDAELAREDAKPVDMTELLNNLVRSAREVRKNRRQAVIDWHEDSLPEGRHYRVSGYELRLGQVIANLLDNARSFIPAEHGRIQIHMSQTGGQIIITVEDNGSGIRAENIERIFERFYTDRPDTEAFGQNSGLGLSISRQIIEAHGGTLIAENVFSADTPAQCCGARFIIRLPAFES